MQAGSTCTSRRRRAPIRASASRPACGTPARRRGTSSSSPRRGRPRSSSAARISDLAFLGNYAIQGSYNGYQVWDIAIRRTRRSRSRYFCPASQSDVSVYKNLLFVSAEAGTGAARLRRAGRVKDPVSQERIRGIRIFDISDIAQPEVRRATCRRAAARTRTRCSSIRRTQTTCTSTSPVRPASAIRRGARRLLEHVAEQGSELGALPHRSHQGAARASGAGGDRELAAHLQRSRRAARRTGWRPPTWRS